MGRRRFRPWSMAVMVPSGISMILMMRASVPILYRSISEGSSTLMSRCEMAASILLVLYTSLTSLMDFSLPMEIGVTVEGKRTALRRASTGRMSGSSLSFSFCTVSMLTTGTIFTSPDAGLNNSSIVCFIIVFPSICVSRAQYGYAILAGCGCSGRLRPAEVVIVNDCAKKNM